MDAGRMIVPERSIMCTCAHSTSIIAAVKWQPPAAKISQTVRSTSSPCFPICSTSLCPPRRSVNVGTLTSSRPCVADHEHQQDHICWRMIRFSRIIACIKSVKMVVA
jgi:hypothetical protein